MKITPVITEKSLNEAKKGNYTFLVEVNLTKLQLKKLLGEAFGVEVKRVKTLNLKGRSRKNYRGKKVTISDKKKVVVSLKEGDKIDLFETKEGKKKK